MGYPEWWEERQKSRAGAAQAKLVVGMNHDGTPRRMDGGNHGESGGPGVGTRSEDQPVGGNARGAGNVAEKTKGIVDRTAQGGGNGFGINPNPILISSSFQFKPHKNWKYQKIPHIVDIRPPDCPKITIDPRHVKTILFAPIMCLKIVLSPYKKLPLHFMFIM